MLKRPAAHCSQFGWPVSSWYSPGAHGWQKPFCQSAWYHPLGHRSQEVAAAAEVASPAAESSRNRPGRQTSHGAPETFPNLPVPHDWQEELPGAAAASPIAHVWHCVCAVSLAKRWRSHWRQEVAPVAFWNSPLGHFRHAACPISSWYRPGSHAEHCSVPPFGVARPSAQGLHERCPEALTYWPAAQSLQENETGWPVSFENRPGAHSVQLEADVCAVSTEYVPTGHGLQTSAEVCEAPASEKRPLPHALHVCVELSAASLYSPARHGVQTPEPTTHPIPGLGQQATNAMEPPRLTDTNMLLWSAVLSTHAGAQRGSWSYAYAR